MSFDRAPASNLTTIDPSRPIASPMAGGSAVITEVAVSRPSVVSPRTPYIMVDEIRVGGATPVTAQRLYPVPPGIGDTIYEPVSGDFRSVPRPSEAPRLNPVNSANSPATAPSGVNPGRMTNPRIPRVPRISPGTLARGAADFGIGAAGEAAIDAAWDRVAPDREERYRERTQDPRPLRPSYGEINAGINAIGAGPGGLAATVAAIAGRYLLPDDSDPGNPNGLLGRAMGWNDEYPNQTDPDALDQGPQTGQGTPGETLAGSVAGATYTVTTSHEVFPSWNRQSSVGVGWIGPISSQPLTMFHSSNGRVFFQGVQYADAFGRTGNVGESWFLDGTQQTRNGQIQITRSDGGADPTGPGTPATYAPNPARTRPTTPGLDPNLLPAPPTPEYPNWSPDTGERWPETQPTQPPDTQPLAPPIPTPAPFAPTAPQGEPNTPTNPNAPPGPPDLDPSAPPRDAPDLATDPDTPAPGGNLAPVNQPDTNQDGEPYNGWIKNGEKQYGDDPIEWGIRDPNLPAPWWENAPPLVVETNVGTPRTSPTSTTVTTTTTSDGTLPTVGPQGGVSPSPTMEPVNRQDPTGFNPPAVLPVPVPVGQPQPVNTPSSPQLIDKPTENPNKLDVPPAVSQTPPEAPKGTCFYEFQRVADIQRKATDTQQRASNAVSGFPGLYGLAIESRTKLGQVYDNTEETKKRIRPEDFPIIVPAQIANPNTGMRTIESLGELGVWIVEQLDGVSGKWPMEVPIPGANTTLAVPNMAEAIAEMFGMMISQQVTAAQILNTSSRTLAQAGSATQQAALASMFAKANAEFLGYEGKPTAVDMPLTYSPGKDPGEGLLEESTAKIKGWENTDGTDLKQILSDLMHAAQIIKAVYWRKLDAKGDFQQQINDQIRGKSDWLDELGKRPTAAQADSWAQYLKDVEAGFKELSKDDNPYGRTEDEAPKIKDLTPDPDAPDTTP